MSHVQIIEALCALVESQSAVIRQLADALAQADALSESDRETVDGLAEKYHSIMGEQP